MLEEMIQTPLLVRMLNCACAEEPRREEGQPLVGGRSCCAGESTTRDSFSAGGGDDAGCVELIKNKNKPQ